MVRRYLREWASLRYQTGMLKWNPRWFTLHSRAPHNRPDWCWQSSFVQNFKYGKRMKPRMRINGWKLSIRDHRQKSNVSSRSSESLTVKGKMELTTLQEELNIRFNSKMGCSEYFASIKNNKALLAQVQSGSKYKIDMPFHQHRQSHQVTIPRTRTKMKFTFLKIKLTEEYLLFTTLTVYY